MGQGGRGQGGQGEGGRGQGIKVVEGEGGRGKGKGGRIIIQMNFWSWIRTFMAIRRLGLVFNTRR